MQGSPSLLTVKQVATALGIDERSVRDKLTVGTLKGTKKTVGNKDQWFVHQRDLDAELARRGLTGAQRTASDNFVQQTLETQTSFQPVQNVPATSAPFSQPLVPPEVDSAPETVTELEITDVVAEVNESPEADKGTSGGERLNWLNEDMQKQLMATAEVFMQPLVNRIEALTAADKEKDLLLRAKEEELEEAKQQLKLLPDLEAQRARLLKEIEAERQASEIQFAKAKEREEEAKGLAEENERLKQKAEEAVLSAAKLQELEKVVQELQKPKPSLWKKFFGLQS
ncbi:MAG: hypothetical protein JST44_22620 [Cyanobacteria bacterium SZAS LIN-5]|nr:hypothetical protein [Cyanobacteria bacterium SZAS LIN-5]